MLVIWRGWGWIVPVFLFVPLVIVEIVIERIAGDENLYQAQMWPKILGAGIGAVLVALLGYYFNWVRRPQLVRESKPAPSHHFFFVPMEYWSVIWLAFFGYLLLSGERS